MKESEETQMLKKFVKLFVTTAMCTLLVAGTALAATKTNFSTGSLRVDALGNAIVKETGSYNYKTVSTQPWSMNITSISSQGDYGIRFFPAKVDGSVITYCAQSAIWRHTAGWVDVAYQTGDARVGRYELCARRDNNRIYTGTFSASGWWSADRVTP
jgi:hypothetical protein